MSLNSPPINRLLVANRGEIACRIIATAQKLGIETVALCHVLDRNARHASMANQVEMITGETPVTAYLDIQQIIDIALRTSCSAIHPGYGFLSENADFARAVSLAGLLFIGPAAETIEMMGDKVAARKFAIGHGIPVTPSTEATDDCHTFIEQARRIGFPLLVKAVAGGGGKGMSIVHAEQELSDQIRLASSAASRYFGDNRVYGELFVERGRHIEVQVVGDGKGKVIHLGDRECSIQRRFQKIIEEAPSPELSDSIREEIITAAIRFASAARYLNAGTVEFIVTRDGNFYFMEMNARLQVEHRVTEMITGIDLVELQLMIAAGRTLPDQDSIKFQGSAIECRICAENPEHDFAPETGRVNYLAVPEAPWLCFDSALIEGQMVDSNYDSLLAKLIVFGQSREEAIERMSYALNYTAILGVTTNLDYLGRVMQHRQFLNGVLDTEFVKQYADDLNPAELSEQEINTVLSLATIVGIDREGRTDAIPAIYASMGSWRN
ncbi:acetyl/propionyl/methylcrotonyl-CoA carboxylase subunit alpha [Castellaniella sp.]|uniref:acetyl-CoA carboxylase biotin carboxylase subunit n=1 Tax=Castellaniella sp. TaxID=1955812 RepID=UPI00355EB7C1